MGDTIQQAIGSLSAGSPEFKRALKVLIKYEIHCLLQRLSDTGEEAIVITTSLEDGSQEQLGTSAGEGFLRHTDGQLDHLKEQFLRYCTDKSSVFGERESSPSKHSKKKHDGGVDSMVEEDEEEGPRGCGVESQGGEREMVPNKPVDFSWSIDKANPGCQDDKGEGDVCYSDCSHLKKKNSLASPNDYRPKIDLSLDGPKCKLMPSIQDMAYMFNSATICGKSDYEETEVQDLSIHQRGSKSEKGEIRTTSSPKSQRKRRTSKTASDDRESITCSPDHLMPSPMHSHLPRQRSPKSLSGDEGGTTNDGYYKLQLGHVEGATVIPRCHLDLSVSRIVENLSKGVGDKWNEDDYELHEMERDCNSEANENDSKSGPVYFKCTESSLNLKCTDSICSKDASADFSRSEDMLSWRHDNQASRHAGPATFDSWMPTALKKESGKVDGCKTEEQIFPEHQDIGIKSEIKTEPDYGESSSTFEKMDQSPGSGKYLNPSSGQGGASPIQLNFICKICGQNFRNRQYRDFHVKLHKSPHIFLCHLCSAGFNSEAECTEHQKLHTDPIYQCDNCGYRCTREFRMRAHKEICGEPAKIYKCPFCDKQFAAQRYMRIHMKSHDTRNVHTCPHCQNTYPLKNSLLKHIKKKHSA